MAIWLTQWKCSQGHTSIALAWDDKGVKLRDKKKEVEAEGERVYSPGGFDRWCAICGPTVGLHIEHGRTVFQTLAEAKPHFERTQAENIGIRLAHELLNAAVPGRKEPSKN